MKSAIFLWLLLLPLCVFAQANKSRIAVELSAGAEVGWWVYNKGTTDPSVSNNQGWDRTHLDLLSVYEANALYSLKKWTIGLGGNYTQLYTTRMVSSTHTSFDTDKYNIANGTVKYYKFHVLAEYRIAQKQRYSFSPQVKFGFFKLSTTHPEQPNFGRKLFYEVGFSNQILLFPRWVINIMPRYSVLAITPKTPTFKNEKHNVYSLGINAGLRYQLR